MTDIEPGDTFVEDIVYTLHSGKGSVEYNGKPITVGPVSCSKGTSISVKFLGEDWGLCLTESARSENYEEWVETIEDKLIHDSPPDPGEVTFAKVNRIRDPDIGITELGGEDIILGPVDADVGDMVSIVGYGDGYARISDDAASARGEDYHSRLSILRGEKLEVEPGEEFKTAITKVHDGQQVGYVGDFPIVFPDADVAIGQVIKARISGYGDSMLIGEVREITDEIRRVPDAGLWARVSWLPDELFGSEDPLLQYASKFIGIDQEFLPDQSDRIKDALVAETIRLAIRERASSEAKEGKQTHIMSIRHWVYHKLSALFGETRGSDGEDWFRDVLTDPPGPRMTMYGDVLELANGYYAASATRAVPITDSEAVLISAQPTAALVDAGFDVEIRGVPRVLKNTTQQELEAAGVAVQSPRSYVGLEHIEAFDDTFLSEYIDSRELIELDPTKTWKAYRGKAGYQFRWGDSPAEVELGEWTVSLWRTNPEHGSRDYWLKLVSNELGTNDKMLQIPSKYYRQVCIIVDQLNGTPRNAAITPTGSQLRISCDFQLPRPQVRWLQAIGAYFDEPKNGQVHWRFDPAYEQSVTNLFDTLSIEINSAKSTH